MNNKTEKLQDCDMSNMFYNKLADSLYAGWSQDCTQMFLLINGDKYMLKVPYDCSERR